MLSKSKILILTIVSFVLFGCPEDDLNEMEEECTKTITIPQYYIVNNQTYNYETTIEVPCDYPEPTEPELLEEPPSMENFSYEVLSFVYTQDTGSNTSRLQFEIQLNNPNDYNVTGVPVLTIVSDELEFAGSYSNNASVPCFELEANSNCVLTYDQEESHDLGIVNSMELISVDYFLTN